VALGGDGDDGGGAACAVGVGGAVRVPAPGGCPLSPA
jgi:hypothetical protein